MIARSTDIRSALRSRQRGFLLNPSRFSVGGGGGGDPHWANVQVLLKMNGADASTTFTDSSSFARTFTRTGTPAITTAQSKFGGASGSFLRTGIVSNAHADYAPGTGDFTLEGWMRWNTNSGSSQYGILQCFTPSAGLAASNSNLAIFADASSRFGLYVASGYAATAESIPTSTWQHFAWVRGSGVLKFYVQGVAVYSAANTTNITNTGLNFGGYYTSDYYGDAWLDEIRYTKGVARYTAAFTPPTAEFPTS
jgi:hypothetical protein